MQDSTSSVENVVRVPDLMYKSFLTLSNPRKLAIFDLLCRARGKMTTKDIEVALQKSDSDERLSYIADTLRDLESVRLAKYTGDEFSPRSRQGDWKQTFKSYEATDHGRYIFNLCKTYDSERPMSNLGAALDPKNVVESFAKLKKEELNLLLAKFKDVYFLGGALVSLYYQKHESASSRWLSDCLGGRLSKDEIGEFLGNYIGSDSLVLAHPVERSSLDQAFVRIGTALAGKERVRRWMSKASYSLTPEGRRIAKTLASEFYPENLGVFEEYLRPEKIEADDGILGRAIVARIAIVSILIGFFVYGWLDVFDKVGLAPTSSVGIAIGLLTFIVGLLGSVFYGIFRVPGLLARLGYWRKLRREEQVES